MSDMKLRNQSIEETQKKLQQQGAFRTLIDMVRQGVSGSSSIRTRLVASFLVLVVVPLAVSAIISTTVLRRAAFSNAYNQLSSSAALKEDSVNAWVQSLENTLRVVYHTHEENALADWLLSENVSDETLAQTQNDLNVIVSQTQVFQELFVLDLSGRVVVSTDRTDIGKVYDNQEFFQQGQVDIFVQPPQYSQSLGEIIIITSRPLRTANGTVAGVLAGRADLATLDAIMQEDIGLGQTGETYLVRTNHALLTDSKFEDYPAGDTYIRTQGVETVLSQFRGGTASYEGYRGTRVLGAYRWLPDLKLALVSEVEQDEALQAASTSIITTAGVAVIAALVAVLVAFRVTRTIANPLGELVNAAGQLAAGNLDVKVAIHSTDEIGLLASTFNNMARQLTDLIATLEQRVTARTKDLAAVAEVGTATATILESKRLLQEVVDLTKERFNLYHSHIYLLDEKGENLVLTAGAGEPGHIMVAEGRSIPLNLEQSLVARAARERKGVIVNDVTQAPDFLPNPLLPDTRSELAVPMIVGDRVIGVFDVQSDSVGRFTDSDIQIQTTLAAQLATSIQNVRAFEQSKTQADFESLVNTIGQKIQRATTVEDTLQVAIRELGSALGASRVKVALGRPNGGTREGAY